MSILSAHQKETHDLATSAGPSAGRHPTSDDDHQ